MLGLGLMWSVSRLVVFEFGLGLVGLLFECGWFVFCMFVWVMGVVYQSLRGFLVWLLFVCLGFVLCVY